MFAAVSMLQMGIARWLVRDLSVKHLISTAKDVRSKGTLNDLCFFMRPEANLEAIFLSGT